MAGSYQHIKHGWSMIENMRDASECIEELLWLVESQIGEDKAHLLLDEKFYPMARREIPECEHFKLVYELMDK